MATTNMQQWNPTAANQENDAAYTADSQRSGGATDPSVFLSALANKVFYQQSTYLTALFTAFSNKGFTTSDSNLSSLIAQCANFLTTADISPFIKLVPYAPGIALTGEATGFYIQNISGPISIASELGLVPFRPFAIYYQMDGTGGHALTGVPLNMLGAQQPDQTPNAVSVQWFTFDSDTNKVRALGPLISANVMMQPSTTVNGSLGVTGVVNATTGYRVNGNAPTGQVLTGDGTNFIPMALPVIPRVQGSTTDFTGTKGFGTIFQNTTGGIIYVSGFGTTGGSSTGSITASVGPSSPSIIVYSNEATATVSGDSAGFAFMVPAGYFYQVTISGTISGVAHWTETQIS
jgi:hypothetical protein